MVNNVRPTKMMRSLVWMCLVGGLWFILGGCKGPVKVSDRDLTLVDVKALNNLLADHKKKTIVVDVRSPDQYARKHLAMAINIPIKELESNDRRLGEAHQIVVYSELRRTYLSQAAAKKLMALGYENVYDFREGLEMWERQGGAVVGGQ